MSTRMMERREKIETRFYERLTLFHAVNAIALTAIVLTLGAALVERLVEPQTFTSFGDACWWAIVTVSTTGFGDVVPHTVAGRIVAGFTMIAALAWVPVVTAIVITLHLRRHQEQHPLGSASNGTSAAGLDDLVERLDRLERLLASVAPQATAIKP